ncbi:MAG: PD40 domain-containing protein [Anaerolineae bacterium]|nr:PD40 domain-containing protein [Anaerolineae bacterium]
MTKSRIFTVWGAILPLLIVLCFGTGCQPTQGGAQSPMRTPTAPSEDWPTLTPIPTLTPSLTPQGTPVVKPTPLPEATATPLPPLPLTPVSEEKSGGNLWSILYLPLEDELAIHCVLVDVQGQRRSEPQVVYDFRKVDPGSHTFLTNLRVAPTGDRLSVVVSYFESGVVWVLDLESKEAQPVSACDGYQGCAVHDWSADGKSLIMQRYPHRLVSPEDFVVVDVMANTTTTLLIPETTLTYSSVRQVTFSPDGKLIAWIVEGQGQEKTTEVWLTDHKGEQGRLLVSEADRVGKVVWHPDGTQIAYSLTPEGRPSDIRLLSITGKEATSLLPASEPFANPVWAPDGYRVAMTYCEDVTDKRSFAAQKCAIAVLDRRANAITPRVASPGSMYWGVSWSPDAQMLAFISARDENQQAIWLVPAETGDSYPISEYVKPYSDYGWLPYSFAEAQKTETP